MIWKWSKLEKHLTKNSVSNAQNRNNRLEKQQASQEHNFVVICVPELKEFGLNS